MPAHANIQSKAVKPLGLAAAATTGSLDATPPEPTKLSARQRNLQKKTQRLTGVRMRYRGTVVQRNRKGRGMGDTPSWRPDIDAHCYSRALLVTLFFAVFRSGNAGATPGLRYQPTAFIYNVLFTLRHTTHPAHRSSTADQQAQTHAKTESAIGNFAQHRLGVRMGYR